MEGSGVRAHLFHPAKKHVIGARSLYFRSDTKAPELTLKEEKPRALYEKLSGKTAQVVPKDQ